MSVRVLFIGGWGRSGSTLLGNVLGGLPGAVSVGELRHVWSRGVSNNELCGCGLPFAECEFWTDVGQTAFKGWDRVDLQGVLRLERRVQRLKNLPWLLWPAVAPKRSRVALRDHTRFFVRLYEAIAAVSGASTVVDSTKDVPYAFSLARTPGIDFSLVHLVRDPRAVAHAWTKFVARPETALGEPMDRYPLLTSAWRWGLVNACFEALRVSVERSVVVRYEDFATDPRTVVTNIASLVPAATPSAVSELFRGAHEVTLPAIQHTVAGNRSRFRRGAVAIELDAEWRTALTPAAMRMLTALTLPGLMRYGYV